MSHRTTGTYQQAGSEANVTDGCRSAMPSLKLLRPNDRTPRAQRFPIATNLYAHDVAVRDYAKTPFDKIPQPATVGHLRTDTFDHLVRLSGLGGYTGRHGR